MTHSDDLDTLRMVRNSLHLSRTHAAWVDERYNPDVQHACTKSIEAIDALIARMEQNTGDILPPQESLGAEFQQVLDDNLHELLARWGDEQNTGNPLGIKHSVPKSEPNLPSSTLFPAIKQNTRKGIAGDAGSSEAEQSLEDGSRVQIPSGTSPKAKESSPASNTAHAASDVDLRTAAKQAIRRYNLLADIQWMIEQELLADAPRAHFNAAAGEKGE